MHHVILKKYVLFLQLILVMFLPEYDIYKYVYLFTQAGILLCFVLSVCFLCHLHSAKFICVLPFHFKPLVSSVGVSDATTFSSSSALSRNVTATLNALGLSVSPYT